MEHQHIFITGCTNSGTGMLRFLISQHNKLSVLDKEGQHYCKLMPNDHKFKNVKNRLFSLYPKIYRRNKEDFSKRGDEWDMKKFFYNKWDLSKEFLVEKSGHHMIRLEYTNSIFQNSKFIGITRNGFAVCEGLKRKKGHPIGLCAKHWNRANKIMAEEGENVDIIFITYEDLCDDPQKVMNKIFSHIGVDNIKIDKDMVIPRSNLFGTKKHFKLVDSPDFNKLSIENLNEKEKKIIIEEAHDMLVYFNYL